MKIHPKFLQRLADVYVNIYCDREKGPSAAREWALRVKLSKVQIKLLSPYIRENFKKKGFTPT